MAKEISSTVSEAAQQQIADTLVAASFILHSGGKAVTDFAKTVVGDSKVDSSIEDRKADEKMIGTNGAFGEGGACTSLARAYAMLLDQGESENAEELKRIALGRFLKDQFTGEVDKATELMSDTISTCEWQEGISRGFRRLSHP
ncbi:uncharacterized protein MYCFIDRAFT_193085 [Pseudocercospora fijiensis CIRAD86]|uniref:Uncharacterized protein n=1 Tax=Pseudocercospora fijiensis (strain CIRAD86) TaxID=383855 RepID=N1Q891_PSEFD|nr:uncharacterized protein MYCFIDRAFT_193085 [Pseudocercospora fijiensis CIRAD86]EME89080.1 hypothetical protein MYCFIDRAFT_193085 [Pseudocercospora fijiensis CIRAD86]